MTSLLIGLKQDPHPDYIGVEAGVSSYRMLIVSSYDRWV